MTLTNPPVTAADPASAAAFAAYLSTGGTNGAYGYTDATHAPQAPGVTAAAMKAAMAADANIGIACIANGTTLAAILADATSLTNLRGNATLLAAVDADQHVFPTTPMHKVQIKPGAAGAKIRTSADLQSTSNIATRAAVGDVFYIGSLAYNSALGVQYKILDGTYVNDYVDREDIEFPPLDVRF
jgi:hypothetical protein